MKRRSVVGGICASLLLGAAGMAVAQDEHKQDEHKNDRQETAQPQNRQEQARPQEQAKPEDHRNDERRNQEPQSGDRHPQTRENDRQMQQQERPNMEKPREGEQGRHEQARPQGQVQGRAEGHGGNQRRIPDADFHAHFGRGHHFAPGRVQVYSGRPQFTYSGFVFALVEPWPADWAYDDDDYYIDYVDDEYWLYSLRYPGVRLELFIVE